MEKQLASSFFHGKERYNCTQAVTKAFQEELSIPNEVISSYKDMGHGKAPDGICGSLFAARKLLTDSNDIALLDTLFAKKSGSIYCKNIRKLNKISCKETTDIAQIILEKILKSKEKSSHDTI